MLTQVNERGGTIRRVATLSSFDDEGREILNSFEKWRLVVTSGANVEVAHEALFRAWPRFLRWLEPEKARLEILRGVESAAASWDSHGRGYDLILHTGRRLRDAQALMKVADFRNYINRTYNIMDYLKAARRAARGWRIAAWYTLAYFSVAIVDSAVGIVRDYGFGYYLETLTVLFIFGPIVAFLAHLAAILRLRFSSTVVGGFPIFMAGYCSIQLPCPKACWKFQA
jgi:hypothetical protein